jgi:hypothetical protein
MRKKLARFCQEAERSLWVGNGHWEVIKDEYPLPGRKRTLRKDLD